MIPCIEPTAISGTTVSHSQETSHATHPQTQLDKARAVFEQQPKEREEFERYVEHVSRQTAKAEAEIGALKEQLAVARAVRQQREEYEAMAKLVNEFPVEAASRKTQASLDAEMAEMAAEEARLTEALAFRRRQLAFVVNAVADLKAGLEHDLRVEEERERYLVDKEKEQQALSAAAAAGAAAGGEGEGGGPSAEGGEDDSGGEADTEAEAEAAMDES